MTSPPAMYVPPEEGRFGFPVRVSTPHRRAPLAIAAFLAIPLFFSSLMASTLAQERPRTFQFKDPKCHPICTIWHDPSSSNEARIWLWALVPSLILVAIGWAMTRMRFGFYVSCVTSIVVAMAVVHDTATWAAHHAVRFPVGVDLIPPAAAISNQWDRGEWETLARDTALSLQHWTIGIALAAMLVAVGISLRSRHKTNRAPQSGQQLEGIHATDATLPGL